MKEMAITSLEVQLRDMIIKRLNSFILNSDVKELLDEIIDLEAKIIRLEKAKRKAPSNHSTRSPSMNDIQDANPSETQANNLKSNLDEIDEALSILQSKRASLENELEKLELQERDRYNSLSQIEKQNFEVFFFCDELETKFLS